MSIPGASSKKVTPPLDPAKEPEAGGSANELQRRTAHLHLTHELIVQLESAKRASDQLIYHLPELIFIIDERGRILKGNHAAELLLSKAVGETMLQPLAQLFTAESWQRFWSHASRLHGKGSATSLVEFDLACDGLQGDAPHIHWYVRRLESLSERRGQLFYVVGHDISETQHLMAELKDSHSQLEAHSRELEGLLATIHKQKAQIVEASKLAQLGEMAGGIAHEINNPITIIKGHAEHIQQLVSREPINTPQLSRSASVIAATVDRVAAIVKSMRSLARDGAHDPFERVDLISIINEALVFFREKFRAHAIDLQFEGGKGPIYIEGRAVQVSQVMINLLNNAHDAVVGKFEAPWVKVIISAAAEQVVIQVIDCGSGIPKHITDKIMQPFFTTKPSGRGTGLGLSIASTIIQQHRGSFFVDPSSPHTCFVISLPRCQSPAASPQPASTAAGTPPPKASPKAAPTHSQPHASSEPKAKTKPKPKLKP